MTLEVAFGIASTAIGGIIQLIKGLGATPEDVEKLQANIQGEIDRILSTQQSQEQAENALLEGIKEE